jgi:predicted outer membrane repeat protein
MRNLPSGWNNLITKLGFTRKKRRPRRQRNQSGRRLWMESLEDRRVLAITVDNPLDELDADRSPGDTSLREAIADANLAGETINFNPTIMNGVTISLLHGPGFGEIEIDKALTIDASMLPNGITIDGGDPMFDRHHVGDAIRIFDITDPTFGANPPLVTIDHVKFTGGDPASGPGGAIRSAGRLDIRNCTFARNSAQDGGAIFVQVANETETPLEVLKIEDTVFDENYGASGGRPAGYEVPTEVRRPGSA